MSIKSPRLLFIRTFMKELELFLEAEPFKTAYDAEVAKNPIPVPVLSLLLKRRVGQSLYQYEAHQARWFGFLEETHKRLKDLDHLNWAERARDDFVLASKAAVKGLLACGFQADVLHEIKNLDSLRKRACSWRDYRLGKGLVMGRLTHFCIFLITFIS